MDDKTLLPSTAFDDSASTSTTHIHPPSQFQSSTPPTTYQSTTINSIVSPINRNSNMERKNNPMDIKNTLMSPPDAVPQDGFSETQSDGKMKRLFAMPAGRFQHPLSPPVSPETKNGARNDPHTTVIRDPILFPIPDTKSRSPSQPPLFPIEDAQRVVDEHIKATPQSFFANTSRPRNEDYELMYELKANNIGLYAKNRRVYAARERNFLKEQNAARRQAAPQPATPQRKYHTIAPATAVRAPTKRGPRGNGNGGIAKPPRQAKPARERGETPVPKRQPRDDTDFTALPDYSPPVESLPAKNNSMKVEWRGAPRDLRNDPNVHLLHKDELILASTLRLDCATYLTSKRRVFISRIQFLKDGKDFKKTHAQAACKIDVNKASQLWVGFNKVGWFDPKWFAQYL